MFHLKDKNIEFVGPAEFKDAIEKPAPAAKFMPNWYKNLPAFGNNDKKGIGFNILNDGTFDGETSMTAKKCVPLQDTFGLGYVIPLWADLLITVDKPSEKGIDEPAYIQFNWSNNSEPITDHNAGQLGKDYPWPVPIEDIPGGRAWKFNNPWTIKTPPGYSCIFTTPFNRPELTIKVMTGVVDTDTYQTRINFPFIFNAPSGEYLIEAGTPLVQVIPFKRDSWNSTIRHENKKDEQQRGVVDNKLKMRFKEGYKKFFWSKKKFR